jgi:hypothetical protein
MLSFLFNIAHQPSQKNFLSERSFFLLFFLFFVITCCKKHKTPPDKNNITIEPQSNLFLSCWRWHNLKETSYTFVTHIEETLLSAESSIVGSAVIRQENKKLTLSAGKHEDVVVVATTMIKKSMYHIVHTTSNCSFFDQK